MSTRTWCVVPRIVRCLLVQPYAIDTPLFAGCVPMRFAWLRPLLPALRAGGRANECGAKGLAHCILRAADVTAAALLGCGGARTLDDVLRALEERFTAMLARQRELTTQTATVNDTRKKILTASGAMPSALVSKIEEIAAAETERWARWLRCPGN